MTERLSEEQRLRLFQDTCIRLDTVHHFPKLDVIDSVKRTGFCCLRGLIGEEEVNAVRQVFRNRFSRAEDNPGIGEEPRDVQRNYQKLRVGISPPKPENSRLVRTFYNPLWDKDIYGMHTLFKRMIAVRNALLEKPPDFASDSIEEGLWTASRIHQYPIGGGFMSAHRDELLIDATSDAGLNYLQLVLLMSKKGEDYHSGGGFVIRDGTFINIEQYCRLGDIIIYDGSTIHGVDTIEPDRLLDLDSPSGRLGAFVTLYRDLASDPAA